MFSFLRMFVLFLVALSASRALHNQMFAAFSNTSIRFFDINPSGK